MSIHFSSKSNEHETPQDLFDKYNAKFNFTIDVAATSENAKCEKFYTIKENGLAQDWSADICWMNPPYGRQLKHWIRKAYEESLKGAVVVCLIPVRTDTSYWHESIFGKAEIEFLRGRLKFGNSKKDAPFPSAIVIFK